MTKRYEGVERVGVQGALGKVRTGPEKGQAEVYGGGGLLQR